VGVESLATQPQLAAWAPSAATFFAAREPAGAWARGSAKDSGRHNNLNNTQANLGFLLAKRTSTAERALRQWWCAPLDAQRTSALGEPLSMYLTAWPAEARVFDDAFLSDDAASAPATVPAVEAARTGSKPAREHAGVALAESAVDYNTPHGVHARHFWFKSDRAALEDARRRAFEMLVAPQPAPRHARELTAAASPSPLPVSAASQPSPSPQPVSAASCGSSPAFCGYLCWDYPGCVPDQSRAGCECAQAGFSNECVAYANCVGWFDAMVTWS